jgi:hypothetical protein
MRVVPLRMLLLWRIASTRGRVVADTIWSRLVIITASSPMLETASKGSTLALENQPPSSTRKARSWLASWSKTRS